MRIGIGWDAHRLVSGRPLILGGVEIPHELGLLGHSDADVLVHAVIDGLLGAAALGDIGQHFPDTDVAYQGISSLTLLAHTHDTIRVAGFQVVNIDSVLIAEEPHLCYYMKRMRENISQTLAVELANVSVKATSSEGLGWYGRKEGIAAQAVVLLEKIE